MCFFLGGVPGGAGGVGLGGWEDWGGGVGILGGDFEEMIEKSAVAGGCNKSTLTVDTGGGCGAFGWTFFWKPGG